MNIEKKGSRGCFLNDVANIDEIGDKSKVDFGNHDDSWNFDPEDFDPSFEFVEEEFDSKKKDDDSKNNIKDIFSEKSKIDKLITRNKVHRKSSNDSGTVSTAGSSGSSSSVGNYSKGHSNNKKSTRSSSSNSISRSRSKHQPSYKEEEVEEKSVSSYAIPASEIDSRHSRSSSRNKTIKMNDKNHEEIGDSEDDRSTLSRKKDTGKLHPCLNAYSRPRNGSSMLSSTTSRFSDALDFSDHSASETSDAGISQSSFISEYSDASVSSCSIHSSTRRLRSNGNDKSAGRKRNNAKCRKERSSRRSKDTIKTITDNTSSTKRSSRVRKSHRRKSTDGTPVMDYDEERTKAIVSSSKSRRRNSNDSYLSSTTSTRPDYRQRSPTSTMLSPATLNRKQRSITNSLAGKPQQKRTTRKTRSKSNENSNKIKEKNPNETYEEKRSTRKSRSKNNEKANKIKEKNPNETNEDNTTDQDTDTSNVSRCRAKRAEMRFKRNLLNSHDSLRSIDNASESNAKGSDEETKEFSLKFDNNGGLSSLYGIGIHHGSSITRHVTDDDDESESNGSYLDDILQSVKSKHSFSIGNGKQFFTSSKEDTNKSESDSDTNNKGKSNKVVKSKNKLVFNKRSKSSKEEKRKKTERKKQDKDKRNFVEALEDDSSEFSNFMLFDDTDEHSNSFSYVGGNYSERILSGDIGPTLNDTDTSSKRRRSLQSFQKVARDSDVCY